MLTRSYQNVQANFSAVCDEVTNNREIVIFTCSNGESVALVAARELESLLETAHLLRSPDNAQRLLSSLDSALKGQGAATTPEQLRRELGLDLITELDKALQQEQQEELGKEDE